MSWPERLQAIARGERPPIPYDGHMGFRLVSWSSEGAVVEADVDGRFANPTGVLHGGVLMGLADSAMGLTVTGLLAEGQAGTNIESVAPTVPRWRYRETLGYVRKIDSYYGHLRTGARQPGKVSASPAPPPDWPEVMIVSRSDCEFSMCVAALSPIITS